MVKIKICGITNNEDACAAAYSGADAVGFVFYEKSARAVSVEQAAAIIKTLPPFITIVGVFVNERPEKILSIADKTGLNCIQLHGDETPDISAQLSALTSRKIIKALRVRSEADLNGIKDYKASAVLLDAYKDASYGGTGELFNWNIAKAFNSKGDCQVILSGGLTPENVAEAIRLVRPYAVDVSSGVEREPGKKDSQKIKRFIEQAKGVK
ncbi:MAG: phosphoribosylanthranilate isomerase [Deltaproteobacteria bacterium]|jgi:phosphoribosylanthranilate isomerase